MKRDVIGNDEHGRPAVVKDATSPFSSHPVE
jgi:hypothetical protein